MVGKYANINGVGVYLGYLGWLCDYNSYIPNSNKSIVVAQL